MDEAELMRQIGAIGPLDKDAWQAADRRLEALAKPPGSLGELEEMVRRLSGIRGGVCTDLGRKCVLVFSADNGVVEEGVASCPQSITAAQTINMIRGVTGVGVLARHYGAELRVTDVGVNADLNYPGLICRKIRRGTGNIARGPAMTRAEAVLALSIGFQTACAAARDGCGVLGVGEMGIGNTTTSSAVLAALQRLDRQQVGQVVGRGAGLTDDGYRKKLEAVQNALEVNQPDGKDPIDVLCKVGGLDIAAMAGAFLGAAFSRVPAVIDGFISVVAALAAVRLNPLAREYLFASHQSYERGYRMAVEELGLRPCLLLGMRLGEGSGCPIMFSVMEGACAVAREMATFEQASINTDYLEAIRIPGAF